MPVHLQAENEHEYEIFDLMGEYWHVFRSL
jgi:hypothetical protein